MRAHPMRTTLQLDHDVLAAARVLARQRRTSLGAVISALARQGLVAPPPGTASSSPSHRNGLPLLPWQPQGAPVDLALVNSLRDELT
ncbi:CopG family transcriptional regulator [Cyanobium sp. Cruz-8D1]|uniref:CopG family transcriptional regulator n=2 Tax=unclassified Cyanobium TaxID=2627006 RepID=UPI0020CC8CFD|nr:CopG family transcriptional regulator [Cyanobium sp. Cruz-8D1]